MWEAWKNLAAGVGRFDDENLQRILDLAVSDSP
jgi:hypothetical protein